MVRVRWRRLGSFVLVIIAISYYYHFSKKRGKLNEGLDTSNTWEEVLNFGEVGPDDFVRMNLKNQREFLDPKTWTVKKEADSYVDFDITRCASTAHSFSQYLCGQGTSGSGRGYSHTKFLIKNFRDYLATSKGQSLWEVNVYRESAESLGHVFVLHQFGDNGEFWDFYMSFISRYRLDEYMDIVKDIRPYTTGQIMEIVDILESMNGIEKWDEDMNLKYKQLFLVDVMNDPYIQQDEIGQSILSILSEEDKFLVSIQQLCANETKYKEDVSIMDYLY